VVQFFTDVSSEFAYEVFFARGMELAARIRATMLSQQTKQPVDPVSIHVRSYDSRVQLGEKEAFALEVARPEFAQSAIEVRHTVVLVGLSSQTPDGAIQAACRSYGPIQRIRIVDRNKGAVAFATFQFMSSVYNIQADIQAERLQIASMVVREGENRALQRLAEGVGYGATSRESRQGRDWSRDSNRDPGRYSDRYPDRYSERHSERHSDWYSDHAPPKRRLE